MKFKVIFFIAFGVICINARCVKRQKKIKRVLPKSQARGCAVTKIPGVNGLLESALGCLGACGCPEPCGCQSIFLDDIPGGYNYVDGYGIINDCDRVPVIRLPTTLANDVGAIIPAISLPSLCQCDLANCQCQNSLPYQIIEAPCKQPIYDILNPLMPVEIIQSVIIETPRSCGCQRQKCGCQLSSLDIPCSCQLPVVGSPCSFQYSAFDMPCGCQLPAMNMPCGCQLPSLDCGCQLQAFNSPCGCLGTPCGCIGTPCGCKLPVPNLPYAYQLPSASLEVPCAYQLPALDIPCGNQLPGCGCQIADCGCQSIPPPVVGCGKYLRQVTLQPPFL